MDRSPNSKSDGKSNKKKSTFLFKASKANKRNEKKNISADGDDRSHINLTVNVSYICLSFPTIFQWSSDNALSDHARASNVMILRVSLMFTLGPCIIELLIIPMTAHPSFIKSKYHCLKIANLVLENMPFYSIFLNIGPILKWQFVTPSQEKIAFVFSARRK